MPSALRVRERLLRQASVDRQGAGLVEAGHGAELGDRVEQGGEAACREDRRCVVGGLRPGREPDGHGADGLGHRGQQADELVVAFDRDGRAAERSHRELDVGEGDERMECADLGPGRHGRFQHFRPERPRGVDHRLAAVQAELAGEDRRWHRRGRRG